MENLSTANKPSGFDFAKELKQVDSLLSQWKEDERVADRRRLRKKEVNVQEMRSKKEIEADEIYVARRVIDSNIAKEKPEFVQYIEGTPRLVLFKSKTNPERDNIALSDWFSRGMKYEGWNIPWHRLFDAVRLHGAAPIEIKIDADKPFNLSLEYTPREFLIFPEKLRCDIQKCERIARKYEYLPNELEGMVDEYDFNEAAVKELVEKQKDTSRDEPIEVYKVFCKKDGVVYTYWYSEQIRDKWLKDPEEYHLGEVTVQINKATGQPELIPIPATNFPFVFCLFEYTEEEEILNCKGRAARDIADQDALSNLWTAMVNGTNRAARLQGSLINGPNNEGAQTEPIVGNQIYTKQVDFFQAAYPDPIILQVAQQLGVENLQSSGKVDYAVTNRKDSRKTAKELTLAEDQSIKLSSVNITPTSNTIVEVYSMVWLIVQSQILASAIEQTKVKLISAPPNIPLETFQDDYILAAAGDAEVIKRAEKIANLATDLPLFSNTPLYPLVLSKYLELRFPDEAEAWKAKLESTNLVPIVQQLVQALSAVPTDNLTPEQQQALQSMIENATTAINAAGVPGGTQSMAPGQPNPPANQGPPPPQAGATGGGGQTSR